MANLNQSQIGYNMGDIQRNTQPIPIQYPYGNNFMTNAPYNNYIGQQPNGNMQQGQYLKCRPVSSKEEAMAFQIDLDGSLWVFINVAKGKIYTKQINNDGSATFNTYILTQDHEEFTNQDFVTRNEFNKALQDLMVVIQANNTANEQKNAESVKQNNVF